MKTYFCIEYYDRYSRVIKAEKVFADAFLYWSYNTIPGRFATGLLVRQKNLSRLYGWYCRSRWSRRRMKPFVQKMNISINQLTRPLDEYASFNDFFTREIDLSRRPINTDPHTCISPADGKVLAYQDVEADRTFQIKRSTFNLRRLLGSDVPAQQFSGGTVIIIRLGLADYHHFHFPDSGMPREAVAIRGKYFAGGPYALDSLIPFYTENQRMVTLFDTDHFSRVAMVEIGAFTVGSIRQCYRQGKLVSKGTRKGFFEIGGSTVVLVFQKNVIKIDEDICMHTRAGIETRIHFGDSVGTAVYGPKGYDRETRRHST